jgi:hypothetical protein
MKIQEKDCIYIYNKLNVIMKNDFKSKIRGDVLLSLRNVMCFGSENLVITRGAKMNRSCM